VGPRMPSRVPAVPRVHAGREVAVANPVFAPTPACRPLTSPLPGSTLHQDLDEEDLAIRSVSMSSGSRRSSWGFGGFERFRSSVAVCS